MPPLAIGLFVVAVLALVGVLALLCSVAFKPAPAWRIEALIVRNAQGEPVPVFAAIQRIGRHGGGPWAEVGRFATFDAAETFVQDRTHAARTPEARYDITGKRL